MSLNLLVVTDLNQEPAVNAKQLEEAGLHITMQLPERGVFSGTATEAALEKIKAVKGVRNVVQESGYRIAPGNTAS